MGTAPTTFQFYSFIQNVVTGNVLDVNGGNPLPFTQVIAYPQKTTASGQGNQLWAITPDGLIINQSTGLALNVAFADSSPGSQVITWPAASGGANQQWTLQNGQIVSGLGGNVLDVASTDAGAAVVINPPNGATIQTWQLVPANIFGDLMALPAQPFPQFTDEEAIAYMSISESLSGTADIRSQYTNTNFSFTAALTQLVSLPIPPRSRRLRGRLWSRSSARNSATFPTRRMC